MQGLRIIFFICMVFLIVSQLFCLCKIDGAKIDKTKSKEPKEILKKMTTDLEKCAKTNKNEANKLVQKCLSNIKKQKNILDKKDKTEKDVFKKVVTNLIKCMDKSKKPINKKSKKNRHKRSFENLPPEMMEEIFGNLSPHELMTNMVNVCPRFRDVIIGMFRAKFQHSYWKQIKFTEMPY